jgi:hypothetical protein
MSPPGVATATDTSTWRFKKQNDVNLAKLIALIIQGIVVWKGGCIMKSKVLPTNDKRPLHQRAQKEH